MQSWYILCVFACLALFHSVVAKDSTNDEKLEKLGIRRGNLDDTVRNKRADSNTLDGLDSLLGAIGNDGKDLDALKHWQKLSGLFNGDPDATDNDATAMRHSLDKFQRANKRRHRRSSGSWWFFDCPGCDQNKLVNTNRPWYCGRCPAPIPR